MIKAKLRALLELIEELTMHGEGSWQERRNALMNEASDAEKGALIEFIAWFPDE